MKNNMTYEEFLMRVKDGIVTENGNCPMTPALELLQGKWTAQVLYLICINKTVRFGELKRELKEITNTVLTSTLRDLENEGLIIRKQFNEIPPHVEYSFSEKGMDLYPIFFEMMKWGMKYDRSYYGDEEN